MDSDILWEYDRVYLEHDEDAGIIKEMIGKVFSEVKLGTFNGDFNCNDYIAFYDEHDIIPAFIMTHKQDCCESVYLEDICGSLDDLVGADILIAEEVSNYNKEPLSDSDESYTWTFYKFSTVHGSVTLRWYGSSNGYYSESANIYKRKLNNVDD